MIWNILSSQTLSLNCNNIYGRDFRDRFCLAKINILLIFSLLGLYNFAKMVYNIILWIYDFYCFLSTKSVKFKGMYYVRYIYNR